jgi:hypothetical protein
VELQKNRMPDLHKEACWALPDKGSAVGLGDLQCLVEAARLVGFPRFAEVVGLFGLPYFAKAAEHSHLELVEQH